MAARPFRFIRLGLMICVGLALSLAAEEYRGGIGRSGWRQHDNHRPRPPVVEPSNTAVAVHAPADSVVLFDGKDLNAWQTPEGTPAGWKLGNGFLEVLPGAGPIQTKARFGDIQLHVEWASPSPPAGTGQDRGNSGIFLMGQFELQVLDSYRTETYADGQAGAIYGQYPPLFNASRPPGDWQTYDVAFRRPRFDGSGKLLEPARITLFHNGVLVQNNEEPWGQTSWLESVPYDPRVDQGPIQLQDHSHPVRFRNIWLRELPERLAPSAQGETQRDPRRISLTPEALDSYVGEYIAGTEPKALRVHVSKGEGHLIMRLPSRPTPLRLEPASETVFVLPNTDARFTFKKDARGRVTGALFQIGDSERVLTRNAH